MLNSLSSCFCNFLAHFVNSFPPKSGSTSMVKINVYHLSHTGMRRILKLLGKNKNVPQEKILVTPLPADTELLNKREPPLL